MIANKDVRSWTLCEICFESNATGETSFSLKDISVTNAVDANEVQGNVVTVKEGKKQVIEAITNEEVAQRNRQRMPVNIRKATK